MPPTAAFTVDLEPDCPPYLQGFRGVEQGLPKLLDLLATLKVPATFFTTGDVAKRFPSAVRSVVERGHELACHGMTHTAFTAMDRQAARHEIVESAAILRDFAPVTSFRAPYLKFPDEFLDLIVAAGFTLDSSQGKYKRDYHRSRSIGAKSPVMRIPASVTSSVLRTPRVFRELYIRALRSPAVLFVHPWEFIDLRAERLRYDCRFRTGDIALECVADVLRRMTARGTHFQTMRELASLA